MWSLLIYYLMAQDDFEGIWFLEYLCVVDT